MLDIGLKLVSVMFKVTEYVPLKSEVGSNIRFSFISEVKRVAIPFSNTTV